MIIGLLILFEPARRTIVTRLQAPDYATGVLTESGGWALKILAGFVVGGLMSVVAFRTRQPGFGVVAGLFALACLAISLTIGTQTWLDAVGTPATTRGTVTYHFIDSRKGGATHYLQVNGNTYTATPGVYRQTVDGQCAVLTYGPRTKVVTATFPCAQ